ncbi:MAG: hypothetical protein DIZ78_09885 [endosymbiont of Escarpia spicata]|uniref:Surface antigen domain-containing protein n=1 Tax=endosymbiont of Escarpia spicata TaxID=2200908 RepID=A0A370DNC9_9GAMM|nr:MAG: hypothetical protein DIZ78_09885 [endosymbiont of Escarpia spicata]
METDRKIHLLILTACLASVTGCATSMSAPLAKTETVQKVVATYFVSNPLEAAILTEIPTMNPGESGAAGSVIFVAGELYAAASGRRCRPVTITMNPSSGITRGRVACNDGHNWFFSGDVFLTGSIK